MGCLVCDVGLCCLFGCVSDLPINCFVFVVGCLIWGCVWVIGILVFGFELVDGFATGFAFVFVLSVFGFLGLWVLC